MSMVKKEKIGIGFLLFVFTLLSVLIVVSFRYLDSPDPEYLKALFISPDLYNQYGKYVLCTFYAGCMLVFAWFLSKHSSKGPIYFSVFAALTLLIANFWLVEFLSSSIPVLFEYSTLLLIPLTISSAIAIIAKKINEKVSKKSKPPANSRLIVFGKLITLALIAVTIYLLSNGGELATSLVEWAKQFGFTISSAFILWLCISAVFMKFLPETGLAGFVLARIASLCGDFLAFGIIAQFGSTPELFVVMLYIKLVVFACHLIILAISTAALFLKKDSESDTVVGGKANHQQAPTFFIADEFQNISISSDAASPASDSTYWEKRAQSGRDSGQRRIESDEID